MTLSSFADLAARLATADADMKLAEEAILEKACQLIEDDVAPFHEFGTSKMPRRPFLAPALEVVGPKIEKMAGRMVMGALLHGGPNYRELREVLHILKDVYRDAKEAGERFLDDDRDEGR